jgi:hypothetical protein
MSYELPRYDLLVLSTKNREPLQTFEKAISKLKNLTASPFPQCFSFHGQQTVGTFAQRGLAASSLGHCGTPVPITRDAAISRPLSTLLVVLGYFHCGRFPKSSLIVARPVTCLPLHGSMLSETPGCRFRARL